MSKGIEFLRASRCATLCQVLTLSTPTSAARHCRSTWSICGPSYSPLSARPRSIASDSAARIGPDEITTDATCRVVRAPAMAPTISLRTAGLSPGVKRGKRLGSDEEEVVLLEPPGIIRVIGRPCKNSSIRGQYVSHNVLVVHQNSIAGDPFQPRHVGERRHKVLRPWRLLICLEQGRRLARREVRLAIDRSIVEDADSDARLDAVADGFRDN